MGKWNCDRCGKHLETAEDMNGVVIDPFKRPVERFFLCAECSAKLMRWMAEKEKERIDILLENSILG